MRHVPTERIDRLDGDPTALPLRCSYTGRPLDFTHGIVFLLSGEPLHSSLSWLADEVCSVEYHVGPYPRSAPVVEMTEWLEVVERRSVRPSLLGNLIGSLYLLLLSAERKIAPRA